MEPLNSERSWHESVASRNIQEGGIVQEHEASSKFDMEITAFQGSASSVCYANARSDITYWYAKTIETKIAKPQDSGTICDYNCIYLQHFETSHDSKPSANKRTSGVVEFLVRGLY